MIQFDGQGAIITGSGRGLGAAYARLLAERGASVVVHDAGVALDGTGFDPNVANAIVAEITTAGGSALSCYENIESQEGCQRLIEAAISQFGRLDILINNAGWITFTPLEEMTPNCVENDRIGFLPPDYTWAAWQIRPTHIWTRRTWRLHLESSC